MHCGSEASRRSLGDVGKFAPRDKPGRKVLEIERSAQQMSPQCEVLPDQTEARQEGLRTLRVANALHTPLALPCGLMAILRPVVDTGRGLDEYMLHVVQSRNVGFRRPIAAQLTSDDLAWHQKYQRAAWLMTVAGNR